ncbi:MAG: hypothetical protein KatS3mg003_2034 [Candidatus Nitrosocaldaceae archaeon]|nr:MAG: hypothetical protein KatS3mg003_2034 [Candidatus Nitrosocaldaceae archaeon]
MDKELENIDINPITRQKLKDAGIHNLLDLIVRGPKSIAESTNIEFDKAVDLYNKAIKLVELSMLEKDSITKREKFERISKGSNIARAKIRFRVKDDIIIPPFSSKISRSIVIKALGDISFNYKYKPYVITPIFRNDKPLIKSIYNNSHIRLFKDKDYHFYFTALDVGLVTKVIENSSIYLYNTEFNITDYELEVKTFGSLMIDSDKINIRFITPLLLQLPTKWSGIKRSRNFLLPVPSLMLWSIANHWNNFAPEELKIENCKRLVVFSNYSMLEFDYRLRPLTVVYDDKRTPTGIIGWIKFSINSNDDKYKNYLKRLLAYANYFGLGRSRAIGFGMVNVNTIKH